MPASQLKRLKTSLREQGVTGPQRSKKQKKQHAANKSADDRNQRQAALQQIRDSFIISCSLSASTSSSNVQKMQVPRLQ